MLTKPQYSVCTLKQAAVISCHDAYLMCACKQHDHPQSSQQQLKSGASALAALESCTLWSAGEDSDRYDLVCC